MSLSGCCWIYLRLWSEVVGSEQAAMVFLPLCPSHGLLTLVTNEQWLLANMFLLCCDAHMFTRVGLQLGNCMPLHQA